MTAGSAQNKSDNRWLHFGILVVAILIAYSKMLHAGFMSWDDGEYVLHNKDITAIGGAQLSAWFSGFYIGNYHPLTMLSYAIDHLMGGDNPLVYHVTNLLLHAVNSCILYLFIKKLQPHSLVALFVALLFAVHPSQTESVSWIAERKTVLCAFFYLLAMLQYTVYVSVPSTKKMLIVTLLGVAAMLSKGIAVALPLSLVAVDIWLRRDIRKTGVWTEKLPLILPGLIIGMVAIKAQASAKFLGLHPEYGVWDAVLYAAYAYVQYLFHLFVPVGLSVIYPYPPGGAVLYLYLLAAIGIVGLGYVAWRRQWQVLLGGLVFYTANIALLLQFVQVGETVMADRYMYIAGIGIIFPAVYYLFSWLQKAGREVVATIGSAIIGAVLLALTFVRNDIWLSDLNFFNAILDTFPTATVAQYSVGALYMKMGDYAAAEEHLTLAVQLDPNNYKAWSNKGALHLRQGRVADALDALNRCLALNEYPKAYFSRAMLYQGTNKPDLAIADANKVLESQPQNARAYYIKADCLEQLGNSRDAMDNYNRAISYDDKEPLFYIRRGLLFVAMKQNQPALSDLEKAVSLNSESGEALYYRGIVKYQMGQSPCPDLRNALNHGYKQAGETIGKLCR